MPCKKKSAADISSRVGEKILRRTVGNDLLETVSDNSCDGALHGVAELVANTWDGDGTRIAIDFDVAEDRFRISDNGNGMDEGGLAAFYKTGDSPKKEEKSSPFLGRPYLGRFGVASFATKTLATICELDTVTRDGFRSVCREVFDGTNLVDKELKVKTTKAEPERHGTVLNLSGLKVKDVSEFTTEGLVRYLGDVFHQIRPGNDFEVTVNGIEVRPRAIENAFKFTFEQKDDLVGDVGGTIYLVGKATNQAGVHVRVNGRKIGDQKSFVDLEAMKRSTASRIIAEVEANGMEPHITGRRDNFIPGAARERLVEIVREQIQPAIKYDSQKSAASKSKYLGTKKAGVITRVEELFKSIKTREFVNGTTIEFSDGSRLIPPHLPSVYDPKKNSIILNPNHPTVDVSRVRNEAALIHGVTNAVATALAGTRTSGKNTLEDFFKMQTLIQNQIAEKQKKAGAKQEIFPTGNYEAKALATMSDHTLSQINYMEKGRMFPVSEEGLILGRNFTDALNRTAGLITLYQLVEEHVDMNSSSEQWTNVDRISKILKNAGPASNPFFYDLGKAGVPCYFAEPLCARSLADLVKKDMDLRSIDLTDVPDIFRAHADQFFHLGNLAERLETNAEEIAIAIKYANDQGTKVKEKPLGKNTGYHYGSVIKGIQEMRKLATNM